LCPSSTRCHWHSSFIDGLQRFLDSKSMNSNPYLSDVLCHGVLLWFHGKVYDPSTAPNRFQHETPLSRTVFQGVAPTPRSPSLHT
jgi:hypothetical protein